MKLTQIIDLQLDNQNKTAKTFLKLEFKLSLSLFHNFDILTNKHMKKSALTLNDFKKNELPKKYSTTIKGGQNPEEKTIMSQPIDPPGTVRPAGQT